MKIGILGMGGIGSFIGAKLAKAYENNKDIELVFICRGDTKESIKNNGLTLITGEGEVKTVPNLVSDNPVKIGLLDLLLVTTKSFSLANAVSSYQTCLKKDTVIIPFQNGVNAKQVIEENINHDASKILEGGIYIASNIEKPGVVKHLGGPGKIFFGINDELDYTWLENLLVNGGLDATYTKDIQTILWRKYLFVSPLSAMTAALDSSFGEVDKKPEYREKVELMMREVQQLAEKSDVTLTEEDISSSLKMLSNFPFESKTSFQLDVERNAPNNEKEILVDYVIQNGNEKEVEVKFYEEMSDKILERIEG